MANFVQLYKSTDLNAPPLFGAAGSLIDVLNAVLVDGYGYTGLAITSITRSGTTATATVSAAVGLRIKDQAYVTVSGCTGTGAAQYNIGALWTRASATTYTYTMLSDPGASASGTPVASLALAVTSLTESGTNYTAVLTQSDSTLAVGQYITFAGASPGGANIAMKINTVTSPTQVVCTGPGSLGAISGTITYQKSSLAWAKPFAGGTNAQAYRSADTGSNRFYLQVVDTGTSTSNIYGAEVMTADQAVTSGQFPTTAQLATGLFVRKSTTADSTNARAWTIIGDDKTFYFICNSADANLWHSFGFGYFIPFKPGDGFNTFIAGNMITGASPATAYPGLGSIAGIGSTIGGIGLYVPRLYTQTGAAISSQLQGYGGLLTGTTMGTIGANSGAGAGITYPNPSDSGLYASQLLIFDATGSARGRMPGYYQPLQILPLNNYDVVTGITGLSGVTLTTLSIGGGYSVSYVVGQCFVDTFGPWT